MSDKVVVNLATGMEDAELDGIEFVANASIAGATPLWGWVGDEAATVFSY